MELLHVFAPRVAREVIVSAEAPRLRAFAVGVIALILLRGIVAAVTPLSFDEAYYWTWSKHLAAGYYDHPPAIAYVIRAGTLIFGDTSVGVRFVPWLLSMAASWAVWRAGALLLDGQYGAGLVVLFFNLMPMVGVEGLVATPDAPEIAAAAFLLYGLAEVAATEKGVWWMATGIAAGFALLSKYTGFFLGLGILVWLACVPKERRWFLSLWPYAGGVIALLMFVPVVLWNAQHNWVSFALQFGRVESSGLTLRFLGEFLAGQVGLATPFIAILAFAGIAMALRSRGQGQQALMLAAAMIVPASLYFVWHSLHDRVQGNWPSFLYPALAIAAAAACVRMQGLQPAFLLRASRYLAIPFAAVMIMAVYAQALFDIVPIREPVSRLLAFNMAPVVRQLEDLRVQQHATAIATTSYALSAWFSFYMRDSAPVIQLNERFRYLDQPPISPSLLAGPLLYVTEIRNEQSALLAQHFQTIAPVARIDRTRGGAVIDRYAVYRLDGAKAGDFD
jgi:4-amino-4-deoxy-L-arabinose transferase-like glycosyltransferase